MSHSIPVFIVGCPRSGTYLLLKLISENFDFASPIETHFIPYFRRYCFLYGNLEKKDNRTRLVNAIFEFLNIWTPIMMQSHDREIYFEESLLNIENEKNKIVENSNSFETVVEAIFNSFAEKKKKKSWVDKSAFFECLDISKTTTALSGSKVIHIVRDGRDVACSWIETWHGPQNVVSAAMKWKKHVESKRSWGEANPALYLEIKYEELVSEPQRILDRVALFLKTEIGSPLDTKKRGNELGKALSILKSHTLINANVTDKRIGRYTKSLSPTQLNDIESCIGQTLKYFGYQSVCRKKTVKQSTKIFWVACSDAFSKNAILRFIKSVLPIILWIFSLIGIKFPRTYIKLAK